MTPAYCLVEEVMKPTQEIQEKSNSCLDAELLVHEYVTLVCSKLNVPINIVKIVGKQTLFVFCCIHILFLIDGTN